MLEIEKSNRFARLAAPSARRRHSVVTAARPTCYLPADLPPAQAPSRPASFIIRPRRTQLAHSNYKLAGGQTSCANRLPSAAALYDWPLEWPAERPSSVALGRPLGAGARLDGGRPTDRAASQPACRRPAREMRGRKLEHKQQHQFQKHMTRTQYANLAHNPTKLSSRQIIEIPD